MTKSNSGNGASGIWAPLTNLDLASKALERAMTRNPSLPGMVCFNGPSGVGKTMAASYCANKWNAIFVQCRSVDTAKSLMASILEEAGLVAGRTLAEMLEQIVAELQVSRRPLIIDEFDYIAEGKAAQLIRDIHDASGCAVMLIGEEHLQRKLVRIERFHNRVLVWQYAAFASERDARALANFYCDIPIEEDAVKRINERSSKVARRICVNIDGLRSLALAHGLKKITAADLDGFQFFTGEAPRRGQS